MDHKLETTVQKTMEEYNIPGAVIGIWIPGKGEWVSAIGVADKETKEKMTINDHFKVDHLPLALVMIGFFQLLDEGKISLDDKLSKYVKNVPNGDKLTLGQLIDPNSEVPSLKGIRPSKGAAKTLQELKENMKELKPHTLQEYVDSGFRERSEGVAHGPAFELLALVIEKVSGMNLEEYFEKNIFEPLKLKNTSMPFDYGKMPEPFAHGYTKIEFNKVESEVDTSIANPMTPLIIGVSTLPDLKILAHAIGDGKLLSQESFQQMQKWKEWGSNNIQLGLGIMLDNGWLSPMVGNMPGFDAVIAYHPKEKVIFVCLINTNVYVEKNDRKIPPARFISREIAALLNLPLMSDAGFPSKEYGGPSQKGKKSVGN